MRHPRLIALCALPLLAAGGCKKNDPEPAEQTEEKTDSKEEEAGGKDAAESKDAAPSGDKTEVAGIGVETAALIQNATAAAAAAPLLEHEGILGHFMMGNAVESVKEIQTQLAPPSVASMVDLEALKSLTAMQLGDRSAVAVAVDLSKPFGCALVDSDVVEAPVVCVVGYKDGAEGLVRDLGEKDKISDAKGHVAAYKVEGQEVFIDALGDQIALSNHPDLFATAKGYLETNIVGRADKAIADFELMVYPNAALVRYKDEVEDLVDAIDDLGDASPTSPTDLRKRVEEMDQLAIGFGLTPEGAHFSLATHAVAGSDLANEFDNTYGGRMSEDFVGKLPMSTFVLAGMQSGTGIIESENWDKAIKLLSEGVAKEFGMDASELEQQVADFVKEEAELYTRDVAMGMVYEPGTMGGLVLEVGKKAPGRDAWKRWSERFTTEAVLPAKAQEGVRWSFEAGATTIDGVEIDRWSIGPTPEVLKEASADADFEHIRKLWPDMTVNVDRAELDDRVIFIVAPTESDTYMQSAIKAVRGGKTVRDRKGWKGLATSRSGLTALYAIDVAGGVEWLRPLLPPGDAADIPSPLGVGLDDVTLVLRHPAPGVISGSFNVSQPFIDQLKPLADR